MAGAAFGVTIRASAEASAGVTRVPGGRLASGADVRTTIQPDPFFAGSVKLPVNVDPAASVIWSPGWAASSAAWKSPPAPTAMVRFGGGGGRVSTVARGSSGAAWAAAMDGHAPIAPTTSAEARRTIDHE